MSQRVCAQRTCWCRKQPPTHLPLLQRSINRRQGRAVLLGNDVLLDGNQRVRLAQICPLRQLLGCGSERLLLRGSGRTGIRPGPGTGTSTCRRLVRVSVSCSRVGGSSAAALASVAADAEEPGLGPCLPVQRVDESRLCRRSLGLGCLGLGIVGSNTGGERLHNGVHVHGCDDGISSCGGSSVGGLLPFLRHNRPPHPQHRPTRHVSHSTAATKITKIT